MLFSANFYQFLQKNFKKWWGWDFTCPVEQVDCRQYQMQDTEEHRRHKHRRHKRHHKHRKHRRHSHSHEARDRHTIILDLQTEDLERAERDLHEAERNLERNLERALRDLERLHEQMEWDGNVEANLERLEAEIQIKANNLQNLKRQLRIHIPREHLDEVIEEFHFDERFHFDDNVEIRIRTHR